MSQELHTPSYVMSGKTGFTDFYALTRSQVAGLCHYLQTASFLDNIQLLFQTPAENIVSLRCYPFDIKSAMGITTEDANIYVSVVDTGIKGSLIGSNSMPIFNLGSITISEYFHSFLDYAPYTKIELYLPYIGFVNLDVNEVMGKTIVIEYVVDIFSGKCTAFISRGTGSDRSIIMAVDGTIGIDVQIGGGQGAEIARNMLKLGISATAGAITVGMGAVAVGTSKTINTASKIASIAGVSAGYLSNTAINAIQAGQSHISKGGATQSGVNFFAPQNCYLVITRPSPRYPTNYNHTVGKPSGVYATLGDLTGFTVVDSIHVEGLDTATSDEIAEVERLLKQGVILSGSTPPTPPTPTYELSGTYRFNDNPIIDTDYTDPNSIKQPITFTVPALLNSGTSLKYEYYGIELRYSPDYNSAIEYSGDNMQYNSVAYRNNTWSPISTTNPQINGAYQTIDFGSTPQTVSKEFYEQFIANAVKINT